MSKRIVLLLLAAVAVWFFLLRRRTLPAATVQTTPVNTSVNNAVNTTVNAAAVQAGQTVVDLSGILLNGVAHSVQQWGQGGSNGADTASTRDYGSITNSEGVWNGGAGGMLSEY